MGKFLLTFGASRSEAELGDRKRNKAILEWLKAMPLHQDVEQGHRKAKFGFEIVPDLVAETLEFADIGQHGQNRFNNHADIPFTALEQA